MEWLPLQAMFSLQEMFSPKEMAFTKRLSFDEKGRLPLKETTSTK